MSDRKDPGDPDFAQYRPAVGIMLLLSRPLMTFVSKHPTVVILCLG